MKRECCGKKLTSEDALVDSGVRNQGHIVWRDVRKTPGFATWQCSVCGKVYTQKLRTSKKA